MVNLHASGRAIQRLSDLGTGLLFHVSSRGRRSIECERGLLWLVSFGGVVIALEVVSDPEEDLGCSASFQDVHHSMLSHSSLL